MGTELYEEVPGNPGTDVGFLFRTGYFEKFSVPGYFSESIFFISGRSFLTVIQTISILTPK